MTSLAVSIEGDRVRVPATALEHRGFREWLMSPEFPEGVDVAFIGGELFVEMSPESIESHNKVKAEVSSEIVRFVREEGLGEVYADGALLTNEQAKISTEPDLTFAKWETLRSGRLHLIERAGGGEFVELVGTPDLVVEVVSDSSVRKDLVQLRTAYARAGVPEYWIIDARGVHVALEILRLVDESYVAAPSGEPPTSRVLGRKVALERSKNPLGRWAYRLRLT